MAKLFTLEEANAIVNEIRPLMTELMEIRQAILEKQPEIWPALAKAAGNGGNRDASQAALEFQRMEALIHAITETGAEVKDLNNGLVDFLSLREGRQVYLCWQYGEDEIGFWHDLDGGFAGRQPV